MPHPVRRCARHYESMSEIFSDGRAVLRRPVALDRVDVWE
jgi:hypothetical protein